VRVIDGLSRGAIVALTASTLLVLPAQAQTINEEGGHVPGLPDPSIASSLPRELADPAGVRSALAGRGVTFGVNYIGEVLGNPSGGFQQGTYYDGRLEVAITADLEKAIGWKGLTFFANGYQIHGESITGQDLGALMPVSFIEATPATRLFELWFEQKLLDDKLSIRFGQLAADSEFLLSDGAGAFINGTWGWPSITAANMPQGGPAYPLATPGVRVAFTPNDQLTLMAGVYNGRPAGNCPDGDDPQVCNNHGLDFPIDDPPLVMFEGAYKYNQGEGELPGTIKLGGWKNFGTFFHQRFDSAGAPIAISGNDPAAIDGDYGLYAIIDQMIYRMPGGGDPKGISIFGRVIGAPEDRNLVDIYWEGGFTFTGMSASRPNDMLGIGFAYTGISSQVSAFQVDDSQTVIANYESMVEVSYTAQIIPGFTIQPDFQYFWNPGGHAAFEDNPNRAVPNAAVLGVRSIINY
jgi:porin